MSERERRGTRDGGVGGSGESVARNKQTTIDRPLVLTCLSPPPSKPASCAGQPAGAPAKAANGQPDMVDISSRTDQSSLFFSARSEAVRRSSTSRFLVFFAFLTKRALGCVC